MASIQIKRLLSILRKAAFDPGKKVAFDPRENVYPSSQSEIIVFRPRGGRCLLRSKGRSYSFRYGEGRDSQSRPARQILAKKKKDLGVEPRSFNSACIGLFRPNLQYGRGRKRKTECGLGVEPMPLSQNTNRTELHDILSMNQLSNKD